MVATERYTPEAIGVTTGEKYAAASDDGTTEAAAVQQPAPDISQVLRSHLEYQSIARKYRVKRPLTDLGNAERFADNWHALIRYDGTTGQFMLWDGKRWKPDLRNFIQLAAKKTVREIYREAETADREHERKAIADHAKRSEAANRISSMLRLATGVPELAAILDDFDTDPDALNVGNGIVDLRTGELHDHRPDSMHTKLAQADYKPAMLENGADDLPKYYDAAPHFFNFLTDISVGRHDWIEWLQCLVGYAATGYASEQLAAFFVGSGSNGKGTLTELLLQILGEYSTVASPELMVNARTGSGPTPEIAKLKGVRLLSIQETESDARLSEARFKWLTGGDTLTGRYLYGNLIEFAPSFTPILSTNHAPRVTAGGPAVWRRIGLLPFDFEAKGAEVDRHLGAKLRDERDAILAWIIDGARKWYSGGMPYSETVEAATAQYKQDEDRLAPFLRECVEGRATDEVKTSEVYRYYLEWSETQGDRAMSKRAFHAAMKERGYTTQHRRIGDCYQDIRLV